MSHEFYDEDIQHHQLHTPDGGNKPRIIMGLDTGEDDTFEIHIVEDDVHYLLGLFGSKVREVSPNEVTTQLSREDIIMLAKTAGVTSEELI